MPSHDRTIPRARQVLLASVVYLPVLYGLLVLDVIALSRSRSRRMHGKPALPSYGVVPDFALTDQTGAISQRRTLRRKVWIADFIFTNCPGPCPSMSSQMHQVTTPRRRILTTVRFVSFTVDPARDTPARSRRYAQHFEADARQVVFPNRSHSRPLIECGPRRLHAGQRRRQLWNTPRASSLVDGSGRIRGYYLTSEPEAIPTLIADAKRLLKERTPDRTPRPPALNATLNGTAAVLLVIAFILIKQRRIQAHKRVMITAFVVSSLFLISLLDLSRPSRLCTLPAHRRHSHRLSDDPHDAHDPSRHRSRLSHHHAAPRTQRQLHPPQGHRPLDPPDLALCQCYRSSRIPNAVPVLK